MWSFIQRIEITCFAASYGVALVLEISRLLSASPARRKLALVFALAGIVAHTLFLAHEAIESPTVPLSSPFDWYLVAAWVLSVVYIYLHWYHPAQSFGLFFLPLVLGLVGVAYGWADREPFPKVEAAQRWGMIHGVFLLLGSVSILLGFAAGLMYLAQSYRLKHKMTSTEVFDLPSLEWLRRINERAIVVSMLMLTAGFSAGVVLNIVNHRKQAEDVVPWSDPIIWTSALMLGWLAAAMLFNVFYKPARLGRKVAYLTLASFVFLAIVLGVKLFVDTEHRGRREPTALRLRTSPARVTPAVTSGSMVLSRPNRHPSFARLERGGA